MTGPQKSAAITRLRALAQDRGDLEGQHVEADKVLLDLIDDADVTAAFEAIPKWYS